MSRIAEQEGIPPAQAFDTSSIRAATQAATDRRRKLRSDHASWLLETELPRIRDLLAQPATKRIAQGIGGGIQEIVEIPEDSSAAHRGRKDLHAAMDMAVARTIDIDQRDRDPDTDGAAAAALARLFAALPAVYQRITDQEGDQQ